MGSLVFLLVMHGAVRAETWQGRVTVVLQYLYHHGTGTDFQLEMILEMPLPPHRDMEDTFIVENDVLFSKQSLLASLKLDAAVRLCSDTKVFGGGWSLVG